MNVDLLTAINRINKDIAMLIAKEIHRDKHNQLNRQYKDSLMIDNNHGEIYIKLFDNNHGEIYIKLFGITKRYNYRKMYRPTIYACILASRKKEGYIITSCLPKLYFYSSGHLKNCLNK